MSGNSPSEGFGVDAGGQNNNVRTPRRSGEPEHRLVVQPQFERLPDVRVWLKGHATASGASSDAVAQLELAASELVTNAIQHGAADAEIVVRFGIESGSCVLQISGAEGLHELPDLDPPHTEETGRGLRIVNSVMDDMTLVREDENTSVRCVKRLS